MRTVLKVGIIGIALTLVFGAGVLAGGGAPKLFVNSNLVQTSAAPKIIDGTVYVPIRAISEGLGSDIKWDNETKTVYVDSETNFTMEYSSVVFTEKRDLAFKWIMAYDQRDKKELSKFVTSDYKTDVYLEFPVGIYNMGSIVDMKPVAVTDTSLTVKIVQRVTAEDEYAVKTEKWKFEFEEGKIKSVKVIPKSVKYFERYTLFPGASFGR